MEIVIPENALAESWKADQWFWSALTKTPPLSWEEISADHKQYWRGFVGRFLAESIGTPGERMYRVYCRDAKGGTISWEGITAWGKSSWESVARAVLDNL